MEKNTTTEPPSGLEIAGYDPLTFMRNMTSAMLRSQTIAQEYVARQADQAFETPVDPLNVAQAFTEFYANLLSNPQKLYEKQTELMQNYIDLWGYAARKMLGEENIKPVVAPTRDKRFKDESWQDHPVFDVIRQSYLLASNWMQELVHEAEGLDPKVKKKVDFYTQQVIDAFSPSNFLMTNPEVLETTLASNGENILKGLANLEQDLKTGKISMTDAKAFKVGENLATTPGYVVYKNDLMELIQYEPTTKKVHETPILLTPAWINKFYILDLQQKNSLVKWLVDQGFTVFVISWVNPDAKLAQKNFEDYMHQGPLTALEAIQKRLKVKKVHAVGYCLGGTLLSITLAYLHSKKQASQVASATYLTTMIDFANAGDLSVFVDEEQLESLEHRMQEKGYLEGKQMALTFNMLRANDLIWSFVVNNYLLGKEPFPFDLLYWNSDTTRMPATMHSFYMRNMYLSNKLIKEGGISMDGTPINVRNIKTPTFILSTREDHIAPWKSTYAATQLYKGSVEFVLAASGHIAGVINPPAKEKYSYWTQGKKHPANAEEWLTSAKELPGSWWPHWAEWLEAQNGKEVEARGFTAAEQKKFAKAPGKYVLVKS